jgi:putative transposase
MPRKARLNVPGTVSHVMARCLRSEILFNDDDDRAAFVEILGKCLSGSGYRCYAWVLMPNHYHLVVRSSDRELWQLMKPLNTGYAHYHGKKHKRVGPLFWDRYKSIVTQEQNYIAELVRYVHLNPVRVGLCKSMKSLETYRWSGHGAIMGRIKCAFQDTAAVLRRFGASTRLARKAYHAFLEEGLKQNAAEDDVVRLVRKSNAGVEAGRKPECWVLGDRDFVNKAVSRAVEERLRISRFEREGRDLDSIAKKVGKKFEVAIDRIRSRCRGGKESDARKAFVYIAVREYRAPSRVVADYCGVNIAAVSALAKAGREIAQNRKITI